MYDDPEITHDPDRPRVAGRPTKLTPKVHEVLVDAAKLGMPMESAAGLARVSKRTLQRWLARGRDTIEGMEPGDKVAKRDERYVDLWLDFQEWSCSVDRELHLVMYQARDSSRLLLNACWMLERRKPWLYGTGPRASPDEEDAKVVAPTERMAAAIKSWARTRSTGSKT